MLTFCAQQMPTELFQRLLFCPDDIGQVFSNGLHAAADQGDNLV